MSYLVNPSRLFFRRPLDPMICTAHKSESLMIWTTIAPKVCGMWFYKCFWHNHLQCKSYQRWGRPGDACGRSETLRTWVSTARSHENACNAIRFEPGDRYSVSAQVPRTCSSGRIQVKRRAVWFNRVGWRSIDAHQLRVRVWFVPDVLSAARVRYAPAGYRVDPQRPAVRRALPLPLRCG